MNNLLKPTIGFLVIVILTLACGDKPAKTDSSSTSSKKIETSTSTAAPSNDAQIELTPQQKLGKRLFIMCEACHNVKKGDPHKVGPNLHGVFGRKAGTEPGFTYSEAVLYSDIIWSDETIREWLINPNDYIKGTNMVFVGLPKKRQQDALLSYLHHVVE